MNEVEKRYTEIKEKIIEITTKENIEEIRIPNWNPVNIEEGIKWIRSTIYEGYYLKYRVLNNINEKYIELLSWEYGDEEPKFV